MSGCFREFMCTHQVCACGSQRALDTLDLDLKVVVAAGN